MFNTFAGLDAPELPGGELDAIQVRLHRWQIDKFGYQASERMALGIIEECGELDDADTTADELDALGDICVYSSQLLTHSRLALSVAIRIAEETRFGPTLLSSAGKLAHTVLKRLQKIRGMDDDQKYRAAIFDCVVNVLSAAMEVSGCEASDTVKKVAEHVMARSGDMLPRVKA